MPAIPPYLGREQRKERRDVDREELSVLSRYPATPRRLLTVDEYHRMGEVGILTDDDRVELIEGELVAMAPIGSEHVAATNALNRLLVLAVGDRGIVSVQNPVRLTRRSEPQPDFAVLKPRDDYRTTLPRPDDTMLAIEVASTSLDYDRTVKLALYARSGIPEVWIVNLTAEEVEIYQSPVADSYTAIARASRSDTLAIQAIPGVLIPVARIFA
jgi:Uma2 family endonuclease